MLTRPKNYSFEDSNIANLGTDLEKKVKLAAAKTEKAWENAGKSVGLQAWRIEKFQVKEWKDVGTFYNGDSYIVLNTYKKSPNTDALAWDIHFWLGHGTSQDEAGTAAYKTVELDDMLGGAAVQHREVEGGESELFLSYFQKKGGMRILEGGVESGFRHVEATKYSARLLLVKGKENVRVVQVDLKRESLNSGDVFILDNGLKIYQFNGAKSGPKEKRKGAQLARAISDERGAKPEVIVLEESTCDDENFWKLLGGKGPISPAESAEDDESWEKKGGQKLYRINDTSEKVEFVLLAQGKDCVRSLLNTKEAFIYDVGFEVFVWIGMNAPVKERRFALHYAQVYLKQNNLPVWLPIARLLEGAENEVFESYFEFSTSGPTGAKAKQKEVLNKTSQFVTVISYKDGNFDEDVELLHEAFSKFIGYDEAIVISVFANRSREYLIELNKRYLTKVGMTLMDQVKVDTHFNFKKLLLGLLIPLNELKADLLHDAVKGIPTNDHALIDILTFSTNQEIKEIKAIYTQKYGMNSEDANRLQEDIANSESWNFKKILLQLAKGERSESTTIDEHEAAKDAERLYNAGEKRFIGKDNDTFISIIASRSPAQLNAIDQQYNKKYGHPLKQAIIAETGGDYMNTLLALTETRAIHFAKRAHRALKGVITDDEALVRMFLINNKSQLAEIKASYNDHFNLTRTLQGDISSDTSFDFRRMLLALLD